MTSTPSTPTLKSELSAAQLKSLKGKASALAAAESTGQSAIESAFQTSFATSCDKHSDLGAFLRSIDSDRNGSAMFKAFATSGSGIFLSPNDRESLPSQATITRSLEVHAMDTPARRTAFIAVYPSPKVPEYTQWLKLADALERGVDMADVTATSALLGNKSTVLIADSVVTDDKGTKSIGRLKRKSSTSATPAVTVQQSTPAAPIASVVPQFGQFELMSDEELSAVPAVVDLSAIAPDMIESIARQAIAAYLIAQRAAKVATLAVLPTLS